MARARTPDKVDISADLKWDDKARHWLALATAPTPAGTKKFQVAGTSTTKALHRMSKMLDELMDGAPYELKPKFNMPAAKAALYNEFVKRLQSYRSEKAWIYETRLKLAHELQRDYHMPVRTLAPLLGMSQARLGGALADYENGITRGPVGRPRKHRDDDEDDDD